MSLKDIMKGKKTRNTRKFINTKDISDYGLSTYKGGELVYIIIKPVNLVVLSKANVEHKIQNLVVVFKEIESLEILCLSSRENFDENKEFLQRRYEEETNQTIRKLIEKDLTFFDRIQIQTASAREFLLVLRFNGDKETERKSESSKKNNSIYQNINRILKLLNEQGFNARLGLKADIKRILAVYFVQNVTQVYFEDFNGMRYLQVGEDYF